jgi:phage terminase Nu1 subunit (DNA packaging protein)
MSKSGDGPKPDFTGEEQVISGKGLAKALDVTPQYIAQLANEGIVFRKAPGKYQLFESVNSYVRYLRSAPKNQWGSKDEGQTDFERERLRRTKEEADKLELLNAKTRRDLVESDLVVKLLQKLAAELKVPILNSSLPDVDKDKLLGVLLRAKEMDLSELE